MIYGTVGVVVGSITLLLPETLNSPLFDTVDEAERTYRCLQVILLLI